MSLDSHIETLQEKHALLDQLIQEESARPLPDFLHIHQLKKQKLSIKEEIFLLSQEQAVMASAS